MAARGVLRTIDDGSVAFFCPGCRSRHVIGVSTGVKDWTFNGDYDKPTFQPSVLITWPKGRCHSFVRDGKIQFLSDCTHALAGQTVALEPK